MAVTITIKSSYRALEALKHVATKREEIALARFIIWKEEPQWILELLRLTTGEYFKSVLSKQSFKNAAHVLAKKADREELVEAFSFLPVESWIAKERMALLQKLLRDHHGFWAITNRFDRGPVKTTLLPQEIEEMFNTAQRVCCTEATRALLMLELSGKSPFSAKQVAALEKQAGIKGAVVAA